MERIGASRDHATEARAAAPEPGVSDEVPAGIGKVLPLSVGIGEELDPGPQLALELAPRPHDFLAGFRLADQTQVGVRPSVGAYLETPAMERADLIPVHPWVPHLRLTIPPGNDIAAHPFGDDEERRR